MYKVFIPAYNEEKAIAKNVRAVYSFLEKIFRKDFRLYLVNDGSTDMTGQIADNIKLKNFIHLRMKGPTRRENLAQAMVKYTAPGDIAVMADADRSTGEEAFYKAITALNQGYDIVIGSRYVKGSRIRRKAGRRIISLFFNLFMRFYFGSRIKDHECGFKFFRHEVLKDLVHEMGWSLERRMFWDTEMLIRAQKKKYRIKEVPVYWVEGPKSALSFWRERSMIPYIFKLRFRL